MSNNLGLGDAVPLVQHYYTRLLYLEMQIFIYSAYLQGLHDELAALHTRQAPNKPLIVRTPQPVLGP